MSRQNTRALNAETALSAAQDRISDLEAKYAALDAKHVEAVFDLARYQEPYDSMRAAAMREATMSFRSEILGLNRDLSEQRRLIDVMRDRIGMASRIILSATGVNALIAQDVCRILAGEVR